FIQRRLVIAAVVVKARRGMEWKLICGWKVLSPYFSYVQSQLGSNQIHSSLDDVGGFWTSGATVGIGGHLICEASSDVDLNCWDPIGAGKHETGQSGNCRSQELMIGAQVCKNIVAETGHRAIVLATY